MKSKIFAVFMGATLWISAASAEAPRVTVYNDRFAVVRESRTVELKKGENTLRFTGVTAHVEPDSVMLQYPKAPGEITVLEQNYEGEPLSEGLLLLKSEGRELDFEAPASADGEKKIVKGKLLRSGYVPHQQAWSQYGQHYAARQAAMSSFSSGSAQPIVEVDGRIMFGLPGRPLFKDLSPEAFLKPTLLLHIQSAVAGSRKLALAYITGGMRWEASYNVTIPPAGDRVSMLGLITLENMSGKDFEKGHFKVMAGDVSRVGRSANLPMSERLDRSLAVGISSRDAPAVTERSFDEYHLYVLPRPVTLLDREIKQVEFLRAPSVQTERSYVYNGFTLDPSHSGYNPEYARREGSIGITPSRKVLVVYEIKNTKEAGLGQPLPRGLVRVYRVDQDSQAEFVGESLIDHTPKDEPLRIVLGRAFDLVGDRKQTGFKVDSGNRWSEETIEIRLANRKTAPVEIRVVEPMWRWLNWEILEKSQPYLKTEAQVIEFRVALKPGQEQTITYRVRYSW